MRKKISTILITSLLGILVIPSIAFASLEVGGTSSITTSTLSIKGYSKSTCNVSADTLEVKCNLWRDDKWVDGAEKIGSNVSKISTSCGVTNRPGTQTWELFSRHVAHDDGYINTDTSYAKKYY